MNYQFKHRISGRVLYKCDVPDVVPPNLHHAYALESAIKEGIHLECVDFTSLDLENAELIGASILDSSFNGANLKNADFRMSDVRGCSFRDAIVDGADFEDAKFTPGARIGPGADNLNYSNCDNSGF